MGIAGYGRSTNDLLNSSLNKATTQSSQTATQNDYLQQIQSLLGSSSDNAQLPAAVDRFAAAWRSLEASPEDSIAQREALSSGSNLAQQIKTLTSGVESLDRSIRTDTFNSVDDLNSTLKEISVLNSQIAAAKNGNQPSGDYEDQRDVDVRKVAGILDINVMPRKDGTIAIYTPTGYPLLDIQAKQFSYNGLTITDNSNGSSIGSMLTGGKLAALMGLRADTSPATASSDPSQEVIRKLRSQLDSVASSFLTATAGPPQSFANAYNSGSVDATANPPELANGFFTGTGRTDIAVNPALLNGTNVIKTSSVTATAASMNDVTRNFSPDGVSVTGASYAEFASSIISTWSQSAQTVGNNQQLYEAQRSTLDKQFHDSVGVNIDQEVLSMTTLQTSYAASARVVSAVKDMFSILESLVT